MDTKSEAGRRIREARDKLGLKLRDVEEAIPEISVSRLSNWEQGINMIGVDEAKKLAPVLHVSPGYILTVEDETPDERAKLVLKYWNALDERGRDTVLCAGGPDLPCNMQWLTIEAHKSKTRDDLRSCLVEIHR